MTPSPARAWRALATEAIADATRRRIVPVALLCCVTDQRVYLSCSIII